MVQDFEILADGNQGGAETLAQVAYEDASVRLKQLQDFAAPFFAQHFR
jgi:hypothetical protein